MIKLPILVLNAYNRECYTQVHGSPRYSITDDVSAHSSSIHDIGANLLTLQAEHLCLYSPYPYED